MKKMLKESTLYQYEWRKRNPEAYKTIRKRYIQNNKKKIYKYNKLWRSLNKDKISKIQRKVALKRKYNITEEYFNKLVILQNYKCKICKLKRKLCVDHCHLTGKIRGLLCRTCNSNLGWYEDKLLNIKEYLKC